MMCYKEYAPAILLSFNIDCYWKFWVGDLPGHPPGTPVMHVFPPDGSCNMLFIKSATYTNVLFVGPCTVVREISVWPNTLFLGVRLNPGYAQWLNAIAPVTIRDKSLPLNEIAQWQLDILNIVTIDADDDIAELNRHLINLKAEKPFIVDERIVRATDYITANAGDVTLKDTAGHVYMGDRQLERVFLKTTGITFKKFAQLKRLRKAIVNLHVDQKSRSEMLEERGYTDPSHFYKSFRTITGYSLKRFQQHLFLIENQLI